MYSFIFMSLHKCNFLQVYLKIMMKTNMTQNTELKEYVDITKFYFERIFMTSKMRNKEVVNGLYNHYHKFIYIIIHF